MLQTRNRNHKSFMGFFRVVFTLNYHRIKSEEEDDGDFDKMCLGATYGASGRSCARIFQGVKIF